MLVLVLKQGNKLQLVIKMFVLVTTGNNITDGSNNVYIGYKSKDIGNKTLKLLVYDDTPSTLITWIEGESNGNVTIPNNLTVIQI